MLPKSKRLTRSQFDAHFKSGKRNHSTHLQLIFSQHPSFHGAVVVGKKVHKRAVMRNQLRRSLYGVLHRFSLQNQKPGVYILICKPAAKTVTKANLRQEAQTLLEKMV